MEFGILDLIQVLGALAFFVYGMKIMSDGIQHAAGPQLRNILRTMTKNRYLGVFTGFLITAVVQSSSATTVMTVSFVNAGLMSLMESAGVMMGANIGTTITGWLVSILGFKVKLNTLSIPLFALGVPLMFFSQTRKKYIGEFLIGFAILFMGLSYLKEAVPDLKGNPEVLAWLSQLTEWGIFSRILFVLAGTVVTIMVQSSSAAMAITLTMCAQGWLPFEVAAAMILGENIGTTITAELASFVGNTSAKRSARIHSLFNIIGVTWMVILLPVYLPMLSGLAQNLFGITDPYLSAEDMPIALSAFHTTFNLLNVFMLIGFAPLLVKVATWSVKSKGDEEDTPRLQFLTGMSQTSELATIELQQEAGHFGQVVSKMSGFARTLINSKDLKEQQKMKKKLKKYEETSDTMEIEIAEYITRLSNEQLTPKTSLRLRSVLNVSNELERIADIYYQISKAIEKSNEEKVYLSENQLNKVNEMMDLVDKAFTVMVDNLGTPSYDDVSKIKAKDLEEDINVMRNNLRKANAADIGKEGYDVKSAMTYSNVFSSLERVGDHIINVTEAVMGEI